MDLGGVMVEARELVRNIFGPSRGDDGFEQCGGSGEVRDVTIWV